MEARLIDDIHKIDPQEWNALVCPNDPFMRHNFLSALEKSGSTNEEITIRQ